MYAAQANSPNTELAGDLDTTSREITVVDASVLPAVPFLLTIGYDTATSETVLVTAAEGNTLTVTRGIDGQAQIWVAGVKCARIFTAKDLNDIQTNIETIKTALEEAQEDLSDLESGKADQIIISGVEASSTAANSYLVGQYLILSGALYRVTATIEAGDTINDSGAGANVAAATVGSELTGLRNTLNHKADVIYDTASGDIASFPDGADGLPVKDLTVAIEPVQDLHGYDSPWPAGGGKNLANLISGNYAPSINSGSDVPYSAWVTDYIPIDNAQNYTYRVNVDTSSPRYLLFYDSSKAYLGYVSIGYNVAYHLNDYASYASASYVRLRIDNGTSVNPKAQLEIGPDATAYEPYSNICPISGWTGCNISHSGADTSDPTVIPITFPASAGTVYGGTLDVTTGTLTVDRIGFELSSTFKSWTQGSSNRYYYYDSVLLYVTSSNREYTAICDKLKGVGGWGDVLYSNMCIGGTYNAAGIGIKLNDNTTMEEFTSWIDTEKPFVVSYLKNNVTYQLTPEEVTTLLGQNNLWADTGDSTVEYPADTKLYIDKKLAALVAALS